jgi:hypothetical protein
MVRQIVPSAPFQLSPQRLRLLGEHRVGEDFLLQGRALRTHLGAVRKVVDQVFHQCVGQPAPRMVGPRISLKVSVSPLITLAAIMSSTHFGIQRQDFCATCQTMVALRRLSVVLTKPRSDRGAPGPLPLRPQDRESAGGERRRGERLDPTTRGKSDPFVDRHLRHDIERAGNWRVPRRLRPPARCARP